MTRKEHLQRLALKEMRHRAVVAGFRPGRFTGESLRAIRADARAALAEELIGPTLYAREPEPAFEVLDVLVGATGMVAGFFLGRAIARSGAAYLHGTDALLSAA